MICNDLVHPAFQTLADYNYFSNDFNLFMSAFDNSITTVSITYDGTFTSPKITYCYQLINDSKVWVSLWFSFAQLGLFHFVMISMSRIFFTAL